MDVESVHTHRHTHTPQNQPPMMMNHFRVTCRNLTTPHLRSLMTLFFRSKLGRKKKLQKKYQTSSCLGRKIYIAMLFALIIYRNEIYEIRFTVELIMLFRFHCYIFFLSWILFRFSLSLSFSTMFA